jgi:glutamate racemase
MLLDLLAGTQHGTAPVPLGRPTILVFDSGLGGLTVHAEIAKARPDAELVYAADDAAFPYGGLDSEALVQRVLEVAERLLAVVAPDLVVVACNTASTLVMPHLRRRHAVPFVGTVPAVKPAAALSRSGRIAILATPGTVKRDYTHELIGAYARHCRVDLVGSPRLAALAEAELSGSPAPDGEIWHEIAPCFADEDGPRTDVVVLACTHYPLLLPRLQALAPWPVTWIDPAPAIAKRAAALVGAAAPYGVATDERAGRAIFTGGHGLTSALRSALARRGLGAIDIEPMPLR